MSETFGRYIEPGSALEYVILSFSAVTLPIQARWRNNSLSADFIANYWATFLLSQGNSGHSQEAGLKDTVSYIANELLENAVKFHLETPGIPIRLGVYQIKQRLRFYVTNSISAQASLPFQQYIHILLTEDPDDLYIRQLEHNAATEDSTESHLGLLTLLNDYQARLGWKFEQARQAAEIVVVTTMAELSLE
jgi:hypothetical protein